MSIAERAGRIPGTVRDSSGTVGATFTLLNVNTGGTPAPGIRLPSQRDLERPQRYPVKLSAHLDLAPVWFDRFIWPAEFRHRDAQFRAGVEGRRRTRGSARTVNGFGSRQIFSQAWHTAPVQILG